MEQWLTHLLAHLPDGWLYLTAVFIIAFSESLPLIGIAVPGSTLIVATGFFASHNHGGMFSIIIWSIVGAYLGDLASFELGKKYGSSLLRARIFQRRHKLIKNAQSFFTNHGGKSLFFARFTGPIRGTTPFIAGLALMPRKEFNIYTPVSAILWGISYPFLGYLGGASWQKAQGLSWKFGVIIFATLCATIVHYVVKHKLNSDKKNSK